MDGVKGPVDDIAIAPEFFDCTVPAGNAFIHKTASDHTAFVYVIGGEGETCGTAVKNRDLVLYDKGDSLEVRAGSASLRFLLLTGKPLNEPVAWQGPIVMNTQEELAQAFREYREGTFIK